MISKVRTFYLLLPLIEIKKIICFSTEPINLNHELSILVHGISTKTNLKKVDIKKYGML